MAKKTTDRSEYTIALNDQTSKPSKDAQRAIVSLRAQIEKDQKALRGMSSAMAQLRAGGMKGSASFAALSGQAKALRERIASAQSHVVELGGSFSSSSSMGATLIARLGGVAGIAGSVVGVIGALITAYAGLVIAVGAAALALGQYALAQADARRSELLHLESLTTIRRYYGLAAGTGAELQGAIDRVADSSALGRGELARYTEQLYRMGLRGNALESALEGVSTVAATQGDAQAARYAGMYAGLVRTGGGVERLSDRIRTRLGGLATRTALGLGRQLERLRESVGRIFGDVRIEGFLEALHSVVSLFSQSTETGRALHEIVTDLFSPIFDQIGTGAPLIRRFFQGMIIGGLQVAIVILRVRNAWIRTFGGGTDDADAMTNALAAGRFAVMGLALAVALLAVPLAALGLIAYGAWVRFQALANGFGLVSKLLAAGVASWTSAGASLVTGFVAGITGAFPRVTTVVGGLARQATDTLRSALGIHSPSRVFAQLGLQVPRGFAEGVEAGTPHASESVAAMGDDAAGAGSSALGRGTTSIVVGPINVNLASGSPAEAQAAGEAVVDQIVRMLEGVGVELGGRS